MHTQLVHHVHEAVKLLRARAISGFSECPSQGSLRQRSDLCTAAHDPANQIDSTCQSTDRANGILAESYTMGKGMVGHAVPATVQYRGYCSAHRFPRTR